jgi:capsular exopolysaccharide synthesis family protein
MNAQSPSQLLKMSEASQFDDSDEGGLDLERVLRAIRRRVWLIAGSTTILAAVAAYDAITEVPVFQARFELLTKPVTLESQIISSANPETLSNREEIVGVKVDEVKLKILKSPDALDPIVKKLQDEYPQISYGTIAKNLDIKQAGGNTDILVVSYRHTNPQLVQAVLESLSQAYLNYSLQTRQRDINRGIDFLEDQLPLLRSRVEARQQDLQTLRTQYNLVDPTTTGQQLSTQVSGFTQNLLDTQLQLKETQAQYQALQQQLANNPITEITAPALKENTRYQTLLARYREIEQQRAESSTLFLEASPEQQLLQDKQAQLLPLLQQEGERTLQELASQIDQLRSRERILENTIERLNQQIKQLSAIDREYTEIQRQLKIATENLNQFLTKREAFRLDAAQKEVPWQLLTPPSPPHSSTASIRKNAVLGAALGMMVGLGLALLLDWLRNVLHTPKELKNVAKLPLLGVIPKEKGLEKAPVARAEVAAAPSAAIIRAGAPSGPSAQYQCSKTLLFLEAFRSLCTNIRLLGHDLSIFSFVVSSAMPQEGKTTVAFYLAQAAGTMDRRVLLVDANLRHANLHQHLGLDNTQGLTEVIAQDLDPYQAIQKSPLEENLFVLPAGSVPLDPVRLLASHKMQELMDKLQAAFDLVVYDAPSLLGCADAHLLGNHTSGILLVAGLGRVKGPRLQEALEELRLARTPVLGMVANGATPSHDACSITAYSTPDTGGNRTSGSSETSENATQSHSQTLQTWYDPQKSRSVAENPVRAWLQKWRQN